MKRILFLLAALPLLLGSCNKDDNGTDPDTGGKTDSGDIVFQIGIGSQMQTKVATGADFKSVFENGDEIGLYAVSHANGTPKALAASNNYIHNVKLTYNATTQAWTTDNGLWFPAGGNELDFYAYYPYNATANNPTAITFNVLADQSTTLNYGKSDLLSASAMNVAKSTNPVTLTFAHKLSLVQVEVDPTYIDRSGGFTVMLNNCKAGVGFNLGTNLFTTSGNAQSVMMLRVEKSTDANYSIKYTYRALVPAQTVAAGTITDWISMGNSTDLGTASEAIKLVLEGYTGTATVKYTDTGIQPITVFFGSNGIAGLPYTSTRDKTIRSITPDGGSEIFIGRKEYPVINLKFSENKLVLRDAVNGTIPIGSYSEFQLINSTAQTLVGSYKQEANLDLMSVEWIPIGSEAKQFKGIFDGNNLLLENILINRIGTTTADYNTGLFGYSGGTLKNIHLASGSVNGRAFTGGVCGKSIGTDATPAMIYNCTNESDVTATIDYTGGICGWNEKGTIDRCFNSANSTIKGTYRVGGVCGANKGSITACKNSGKIDVSNYYIGGICGENGTGATITSCYNTGTVKGDYALGGVCGFEHGLMSACYNIAKVTGAYVIKTGGVIGYNFFAEYNVTNCYWLQVNGGATFGIGQVDSGTPASNTNTTPFENGAWPNSTMTGWTINTAGAGQTPNGNWKSLGSWNNGSPVFPKLWWE